MCECTPTLEQEERHVLSARTLSAWEQRISERARPVLCESKGNPRASREIRAQAGWFALAHYINLLLRYKNALSTFGSKITPYIGYMVGFVILFWQPRVRPVSHPPRPYRTHPSPNSKCYPWGELTASPKFSRWPRCAMRKAALLVHCSPSRPEGCSRASLSCKGGLSLIAGAYRFPGCRL